MNGGTLLLVTSVATYLRVKNWDRFQKQHTSEYIRLYTALLYDAEFNELPPLAQLLLLKLWLCAAARHGQVSDRPAIGLRQAGLPYSSRYISYWQLLVSKGFLSIERETEETEERDRKKQLHTDTREKRSVGSGIGLQGSGGTPTELPAVSERTTQVGSEGGLAFESRQRELTTPARSSAGLDPMSRAPSGPAALAVEGSSEEISTIHIPAGFTEYLSSKSILCKDLEHSTSTNMGGVENGVVEGAESSAESGSSQASPNSTASSGNGTNGHSVSAVALNPVAPGDSRQRLPVPGSNSSQNGNGSGAAKGRPGDSARTLEGESQMRGRSGKGADGAAPVVEDRRVTWLTPYEAVWESVHGKGSFQAKIAMRYLAPLHNAHGTEAVCANLKRYLARQDVRFQNWSDFQQHFGAYGPDAKPRPVGRVAPDSEETARYLAEQRAAAANAAPPPKEFSDLVAATVAKMPRVKVAS